MNKNIYIRSRLYLLVAVWIHLAVLADASFTLGPIRLLPGRYAFSWQASVDTPTGIATSKEVMKASPRSGIVRHFESRSENEREVWADVMDRLERYPEWLVRGAVTFGLFRAVPIPQGGYSLQDRVFGINFLAFGLPQSQRFSFLKTTSTTQSTTNGLQLQRREGDCTVVLPIVGGLLALCKPTRNGDLGCLKFTLRHNEEKGETQLVTEIQGYSPLLVGLKEPVPFHRKCLYLSTQSIVHAYVMWRFQRHCLHTRYSPIQQSTQSSSYNAGVRTTAH